MNLPKHKSAHTYTLFATHPRNCVPTGPISRMRAARPSPSLIGGGFISFSFLIRRQVTRVGMEHLRGGMMMRTPEWRQPRMAPPRASTMKLMRKLRQTTSIFQASDREMKTACTQQMSLISHSRLSLQRPYLTTTFLRVCCHQPKLSSRSVASEKPEILCPQIFSSTQNG